jgi:hypothetical protein
MHRQRGRNFGKRPRLEELEARRLLKVSDLLTHALPIALSGSQPHLGTLSEQTTIAYRIAVNDAGRLQAQVTPSGGRAELTLIDSQGFIMMQSDGKSASDPSVVIDVNVGRSAVGQYYLTVQGLGNTTGTYSLTTSYTPGVLPSQAYPYYEPDSPPEIRSTPLVADLTGGGRRDVAVLASSGQIVVHRADPNDPESFQAPIIVNPDSADRVTDLTLVSVQGRQELAALQTNGTIAFYSYAGAAGFLRTPGPVVSPTAQMLRIVAGDVTGTGLQDLVVASYGTWDTTISVFLQEPDGSFGPATYQAFGGIRVSDIAFANMSGGPGPDIVVTDEAGGLVRILLNTTVNPFKKQRVFRTGAGPYVINHVDSWNEVQSTAEPVALVAGSFAGTKSKDLMVLESGSYDCNVLAGDGYGGVFSATTLEYSTGYSPTAMVAGDFAGRGTQDVAILDQASNKVFVYMGQGNGPFAGTDNGQAVALAAGYAPVGLTVADLGRKSGADLLVGNGQGDVLVLRSNGTGTFTPYSNSADGRNSFVSEFSSVSGSELAVVATLILGPGSLAQKTYGQVASSLSPGLSTSAPNLTPGHSGDEEAPDGVAVSELDSSAANLERNGIITGVLDQPVQQELSNSGNVNDHAVPFTSPLDIFDAGSAVPPGRTWAPVIDELSRLLHTSGTSNSPAKQDGPGAGLNQPMHPGTGHGGTTEALGSGPTFQAEESPIDIDDVESLSGSPMLDMTSPSSTSEGLSVLALGLIVPYLTQEFPALTRREEAQMASHKQER